MFFAEKNVKKHFEDTFRRLIKKYTRFKHDGECMLDEAFQRLETHVANSSKIKTDFLQKHSVTLTATARHMAVALARGQKLFCFGSTDAHTLAEHTTKLLLNHSAVRCPPLPVITLSEKDNEQTALRQLQALAQPNDIFLTIATTPPNNFFMEILRLAHLQKMLTVGLVGLTESQLDYETLCTFLLPVPHVSTQFVYECHTTILHLICLLVDYYLLENVMVIKEQLDI